MVFQNIQNVFNTIGDLTSQISTNLIL